MPDAQARLILTITCPDRAGIVAAVTGFLAEHGAFIVESAQFGDPVEQRFFQRIVFHPNGQLSSPAQFADAFSPVAARFGMTWDLHDTRSRDRILIAVSRFGHCLNDLLHRHRTGTLPADIVGVVSNHEDMRAIVEWHDIPYHYLPVAPGTKATQDNKLLDLVDELDIDLLVLARYMQILSSDACERLAGRSINIHHSFLPSFKGARPYHQAHARGVKIIGATAHYVTPNLDEGPIIEQGVERVDHTAGPDELVAIGRDIESVVLARAVHYHTERRVLINGAKTVVFR
jgi:formyltetrahydrofolate deformylase